MEYNNRYHLSRQDSAQSSTSDFFTQSENRKPVRKLVTPTSSLEIVDGDLFGASGFADDRATPDGSIRSWSRSSIGSIPPRSDSSLSRRTITPTKQVSLQAVRRREESSEPFMDHIDLESARLHGVGTKAAWDVNDDDVDFSKLSVGDHRQSYKNNGFTEGSSHHTGLPNGNTAHKQSLNKDQDNKLASQKQKNNDRRDSGDDSDDDDDDGDEDKDENEKLKAPTELLMEFIDCLMKKDYPNASKLCKMILLYEPENEEALKFQPLIEEKMAIDAAAAEEEEGSTDDEDDDDDDDDDDSDEDSSSDEDDSTDDDDDEDDNDVAPPQPRKSWQDPKAADPNTSRVWKPAS